MIHSPRNLSYCRREATKLRDATPDPTPEQLSLLGVLDDRLFKKSELIKARQERKMTAKVGRTKRRPQLTQVAPPAPVPASPMSGTEETSLTGEYTTSREDPRPGDPDFHSVLEEFET